MKMKRRFESLRHLSQGFLLLQLLVGIGHAQWVQPSTTLGFGSNIQSFAVRGAELYVGTGSRGVYRSFDSGSTWTQVNNGLTSTYVHPLAVVGANLFAGTWLGLGAGVYRSLDSGTSWTRVNNGLTDTAVYSFAVNGVFAPGTYQAGFDGTGWLFGGLYFLRLQAGGTSRMKRVVLEK